MADAKVTITTEAKDEGLDKLNDALADGQVKAKAYKKSLKELQKATEDGTQATEEQKQQLRELQKATNEQEQANRRLSTAIRQYGDDIHKAAKSIVEADKGANSLASSFGLTTGFTTAFSVALGNLATEALSKATEAMIELAKNVVECGMKAQQTINQLSAMKNVTGDATEAWRVLNDTYRGTNFDEGAIVQMGVQLMNLGYSAKNASELIALCSDAAAGLGTGQQGAQQLVDAISRIQAVGELTSRQMTQLKLSGVDMDAAFKSLGMNGEEAMKAVESGTLDTQQAIQALTDYLHTFDGSMEQSKNNIVDQWGDVVGNMQAFCAEIGVSIFDAFNQSGIIQDLIAFTQDLVDMIRGEGCGAFNDLKVVAEIVLGGIDNLLKVITTSLKFIILVVDEVYSAFRSFGQQVYEALQPAIDALVTVYDLVKNIMLSIGKGFAAEVDRGWKKTFGTDPDDADSYAIISNAGNKFRQRSFSGGARSGGGGGGSAKAQLTEEEKAIEAVIKKYAEAEKQKWNMAKATIELAKANMAMLVGEDKAAEEKRIKLQALSDAHDQIIEGYKNELNLAQKIKDANVRDDTIRRIQDQIDAEEKLYEAKRKAILFQDEFADLQKQSKSIIEAALGNPDDIKPRIDQIKENLANAMRDIDAAMANPDPEAQLNGLAKLLQTTPDALAEELALKGESLDEFAENYKTVLAQTAAAEIQSLTTSQQWHDRLTSYAASVGKNMGNALTDWITGAKSASEAMKDFVKDLIKNAIQLMAQWTGIYLTFLAFGLGNPHAAAQAATKAVFGVDIGGGKSTISGAIGASASKGVYGLATGGYIAGPGTGTSDSIPAMLSNGEYVLRSSAVDRVGVGVLNALNAGRVPRFADGGSVGGETGKGVTFGSSLILNVSTMDAASFDDFLQRGGLDRLKQALYEDNRRFASDAGVW